MYKNVFKIAIIVISQYNWKIENMHFWQLFFVNINIESTFDDITPKSNVLLRIQNEIENIEILLKSILNLRLLSKSQEYGRKMNNVLVK